MENTGYLSARQRYCPFRTEGAERIIVEKFPVIALYSRHFEFIPIRGGYLGKTGHKPVQNRIGLELTRSRSGYSYIHLKERLG